MADFLLRVLTVSATTDTRECLFWALDGKSVAIYVYANLPEQAVDLERLTPANFAVLEQALRDVGAVTSGDYTYGPMLFVSRIRRRPPAGGFPPDQRLWPLFEACAEPDPPPASASLGVVAVKLAGAEAAQQ